MIDYLYNYSKCKIKSKFYRIDRFSFAKATIQINQKSKQTTNQTTVYKL